MGIQLWGISLDDIAPLPFKERFKRFSDSRRQKGYKYFKSKKSLNRFRAKRGF